MSDLIKKRISGKEVIVGEIFTKVKLGKKDREIVKQVNIFHPGTTSKYYNSGYDVFVFFHTNDYWVMNPEMRFISSETPPKLLSIYKTIRDADKLKLESFLDLVIQGYFVKYARQLV